MGGAHHHKHHGHHHHRANASVPLPPPLSRAWTYTGVVTLRVGAYAADLSLSRAAELAMLLLASSMCVLLWLAARRRPAPHAANEGDAAAREPTPREERSYRQLRNSYLSVYSLAVFGDWIQGGYLYALYAEYGYSMRQIGLIFVVGYMSAATLGTYVSALGDIGGHRRNCVLYGVIYALSCTLCNFGDVVALACGRVIGGVAYSILYTSFESWLIAEADTRALPMHMLSRLFSIATFTNAASAVAAGIVGHLTVEVTQLRTSAHNKYADAFNAAVLVLLSASALAAARWDERHGDQRRSAGESLLFSWRTIRQSRLLLALGLVNSLYEAALYIFVFMWTPALERRSTSQVGHGLVFSIFMLSKMAGSQAFQVIERRLSIVSALQLVFIGSSLCLAVPLVSDSYEVVLLAFSGFEALLGIYWPAIAMLRAQALDDAQRASTMAVFRLLLNLLVITALPLAGGFPEGFAFGLCIAMLCCCVGCTRAFRVAAQREAANKSDVALAPDATARGPYDGSVADACRALLASLTATRSHNGGRYRAVASKGEGLTVQLADLSVSSQRYKTIESPSTPPGAHSSYSPPPSPTALPIRAATALPPSLHEHLGDLPRRALRALSVPSRVVGAHVEGEAAGLRECHRFPSGGDGYPADRAAARKQAL